MEGKTHLFSSCQLCHIMVDRPRASCLSVTVHMQKTFSVGAAPQTNLYQLNGKL